MLAAAAFLMSCQGGRLFNVTIEPDQRISIEDAGVHDGTADAGSVTLAYSYQVTAASGGSGRDLDVSGHIGKVQYRADSIMVYLHFLDAGGSVIQSKPVYNSGFKSHRGGSFKATIPIPDGAAAIGFTSNVRESRGHR
jgi:hypothetical protein